MKPLILLIALAFTLAAHATYVSDKFKIGTCVPSIQMAYKIVQRLDKGTYEVVGEYTQQYAIIKTKAVFDGEGQNVAFKVSNLKYLGVKSVQMKNGFDKSVDVWTDCDSKKSD